MNVQTGEGRFFASCTPQAIVITITHDAFVDTRGRKSCKGELRAPMLAMRPLNVSHRPTSIPGNSIIFTSAGAWTHTTNVSWQNDRSSVGLASSLIRSSHQRATCALLNAEQISWPVVHAEDHGMVHSRQTITTTAHDPIDAANRIIAFRISHRRVSEDRLFMALLRKCQRRGVNMPTHQSSIGPDPPD